VGGGFPAAVGAGLAFKLRKEDRVSLTFFGDGAINQGTFHESANMAGLWSLPVIFFCENNLYGEGTPQHKQAPIRDLAIRAEGYGFPGVIVDGNDVIAVYSAVLEARTRALNGEGPTLIEAKTYRYRGHYEGDPMVYRPEKELEEWRSRDAIDTFRNRLLETKQFKAADLADVDQEVQSLLDEAVKFAAETPVPQENETLQGVYDDTHNGKIF
jgi:pyruvate dehydrogenase E1 component alpha subunit